MRLSQSRKDPGSSESAAAGGSALPDRLTDRIERLARACGGDRLDRHIVFGLADVQNREDAAPPHLQRYRDRGGATKNDLEEHAAAGGVDVGEIHVWWLSFALRVGPARPK